MSAQLQKHTSKNILMKEILRLMETQQPTTTFLKINEMPSETESIYGEVRWSHTNWKTLMVIDTTNFLILIFIKIYLGHHHHNHHHHLHHCHRTILYFWVVLIPVCKQTVDDLTFTYIQWDMSVLNLTLKKILTNLMKRKGRQSTRHIVS